MKNIKDDDRILAKNIYRSNNTYETQLNNNDLVIGPSGAGKTRGYVKPNIMQCNHSMIIADTKGNLLDEVGPVLRKKGYRIFHINFNELCNSDGYNPLDFVRYNASEDAYNEQDILTISRVISPIQKRTDPFWDNAGKLYLSCLISYVLECLPKKECHLGSVYELVSLMGGDVVKALMQEHAYKNPKSFACKQFKAFANNGRAECMQQSILGVMQEKLADITFEHALTIYQKKKRINFESLSREKTAVFLGVSDTDRSMDTLVSLFYTQALQELCRIADKNENSRLDVPVRFFFDDFATNTIIPDFHNMISVVRSRDIYISIMLQSITQLDSIYGETKASTIINNCDTCLYLGGQDIKTANFIAVKTNKSVCDILNLPIHKSYLCTRGCEPMEVEKFEEITCTHPIR